MELMIQAEAPEHVRVEAEELLNASLPLLLRFLNDRNHDVPLSVSAMVGDLLRTVCPPLILLSGMTRTDQ